MSQNRDMVSAALRNCAVMLFSTACPVAESSLINVLVDHSLGGSCRGMSSQK